MQIHLARDGQRMGPFPLEEVNRQLGAGTLRPTDLAWYEGIPNWIPLSQVPGTGAVPVAGTQPLSPPVYASSAASGDGDFQRYGGFWIRVLAYLLDTIVLALVGGVVGLFLGVGNANFHGDLSSINMTGSAVQLLLAGIYFSVLWSSSLSASLGQRICGLRVTTMEGARLSLGRAVGRYFARLLSFFILCIGVIMVAFTERKQGLHDMLVGTVVLKS